jgi:CDP-diacylglycerol--glycerol-3-phosphate 3-phosphatidyltransferase
LFNYINLSVEILQTDTWIFPLVQMGQLNIRHDSEITLHLLKNASVGATVRLATGYFNLTSEYKKAILQTCKADCHVLTAHPKANGFFGKLLCYIYIYIYIFI